MTVEQATDLSKIIKRLELIKSLISLEEEDEINAHVSKLEQLSLTSEIKNIIIALTEKSYNKAITAIGKCSNECKLGYIYKERVQFWED